MDDFSKFCEKILNIDTRDKKDIIQNIITEEKQDLLLHSNSLEGFCKYIANQILCRLQYVSGIRAYLIDLNDIIFFDHVVLIAEYMNGNNLKRLLIDPTFEQFSRRENQVLFKLKDWPYEKLKNADFFDELIKFGFFEINDIYFKQYLKSFCNKNVNVSLNDYLMKIQFDFDETSKRK